jgi:hypothetical protein
MYQPYTYNYNVKLLMDFTFPQIHVFPELALHFSSPEYESLAKFKYFLFQDNGIPSLLAGLDFWTGLEQMVQSKNTYYQLDDAELQIIHIHHVASLRPIVHEGFFHHHSTKSSRVRPALILLHFSITVTK